MIEFYLYERIMQLNVEEAHRQARFRRLQREVGAGRTSWLEGQRWRALNRLGRLLVSSGQQLLQLVAPVPPRAQGV
jgi:hypothetical protein